MLSLLDVTYLEETTDKAMLEKICAQIKAAPHLPAAICVYLRDIPLVKNLLAEVPIAIAPPINFPHGNASTEVVLQEIAQAKLLDVGEVDVVIPYRAFLQDYDFDKVGEFVALCKNELGNIKLKVILETGEIQSTEHIKKLTLTCCENGADFIKTSTGKVPIGATLTALESIIGAIKIYFQKSSRKVGIKVSGGVRTISQAQAFIDQVKIFLGEEWIRPELFRIGASQLFNNLMVQEYE